MKNYAVDIDITMSVRVYVDAKDNEEAQKKADELVKKDPYYYAKDGTYVSHDITDVSENEEESDDLLSEAVDYVRDNMDEDDLAILRAECNKCYNSHIIPTFSTVDADQVRELLAEYGEENDLGEDWWDDYDEDEILCKL